MISESKAYSKNEWVVHSHYGVGRIVGEEVKNISGNETKYFKIETADSTFWVPVDQIESELLRPLSTREEIELAISALQGPAEEMSANSKLRQSRITSVRQDNTPVGIARLLCDLRARKRDKGVLYSSERSAYQTLSERLMQEWAVVTGTSPDVITAEFNQLLNIIPFEAS